MNAIVYTTNFLSIDHTLDALVGLRVKDCPGGTYGTVL